MVAWVVLHSGPPSFIAAWGVDTAKQGVRRLRGPAQPTREGRVLSQRGGVFVRDPFGQARREQARRNGQHDCRRVNQRGDVMTISEYLAATTLVALILWAVLGLLTQEN